MGRRDVRQSAGLKERSHDRRDDVQGPGALPERHPVHGRRALGRGSGIGPGDAGRSGGWKGHPVRRDGVVQHERADGGDGALWLAANGASVHREPRAWDAQKGMGEVLRVDARTGRTLARYPLPGGGGVHGIEWDGDTLWLTTLKSQTLSRVDPADFRVLHVIPVPLGRAHGLVRDVDGIWCVHTTDRVIVKLDAEDGREMDRIALPAPHPEPHCLTARDGRLWYCDAISGAICRITR
jgi:sugar lactone lactonase YvrE